MAAIDNIKNCVENNHSFVLQGGAGSGKTETLKQTLEFISRNPKKRIICITYTNLAADEIRVRVGDGHIISTIHSFLNSFIKDYTKNLHQIIHHLFVIPLIERQSLAEYDGDEVLQKKSEHVKYKKLYGKYASSLFIAKAERMPKVEGKREYDQTPEEYNTRLNERIEHLNKEIIETIAAEDHNNIRYNETKFNSFTDLTYGHDGLLEITHLLFENYPLINRILQDKFDVVFIDEYQDTNEKIIEIFLRYFLNPGRNLVGLFGDSMQAIHESGIGDVESYVDEGILVKITKEDNYRSSEQVKGLINKLRSDKLIQELAFKKNDNGTYETLDDRQGDVSLYYSIYGNKPHARSTEEEKNAYSKKLNELISKATEGNDNYVQLKLTNKSIASDVGFETLYSIFSNRWNTEALDRIERHLDYIQFAELFNLCDAYQPPTGTAPNYNFVIAHLKKRGIGIKRLADKQAIKEKFDAILSADTSAFEALNKAFELGLVKKSDGHLAYIERKDSFSEEIEKNEEVIKFRALFLDGKNTLNRIKGDLPNLEEEDFRELENDVKKEIFYNYLFSEKLKFREVISYYRYLNEKTEYITMHKTKGGERENVLVVLEEYFWTAYDFKTVFDGEDDTEKEIKNQKLVYVACSRAKKNLRCVRLVSDNEEAANISSYFDKVIEVS